MEHALQTEGQELRLATQDTPNPPTFLASEETELVEYIDWDPGDKRNPYMWPKCRKWLITITVCWIGILCGLPAGSYGSGNTQIGDVVNIHGHEQSTYLYFATTSWNVGAAVEIIGRIPIYFGSYIVFLIFLVPSAVAQNFQTLVVTRFFGGGASSTAINIIGGTITDLFLTDADRSLPMSIFGLSSVAGIALGPWFGGLIAEPKGWRWIFWMQLIIDGGFLPIFWLILLETRGDVLVSQIAKKMRKETGRRVYAKAEAKRESLTQLVKLSCTRPIVFLFTESVVFFFTLWVSFAWGILFLFQSSVPQTFSASCGFSTLITGLIQLALSVGAVIDTVLNPIQDRAYLQTAKRNKDAKGKKPLPEAHFYMSCGGSLVFTAVVPTIGIVFVGIGIYTIYLAVVNYLSDSYARYAASVLTSASLGCNSFGAFLPLASHNLYQKLNFRWASTLLGFIALALSAIPFVLIWKGPEIRRRSPAMRESTIGGAGDDDHDKQQEGKRRLSGRFGAGSSGARECYP
ncbi:MFS general substrate transporter [Saitoella complicata NRRL Y-17804]|uniref:MFS general substrate transporter n=1 Tax=Saitoella complicata (strain BCRC 22490 / CBS 7301 / JCM 7358 / NBRC 10748 / NRRL Y-17804) TaxID=698492 RepID=UPI000867D601|nr:MFS general substrate transporter [Saitoella complicata NRRL Y-17804]ODQ49831.1 MFS general substrate transporter [Saitoella complicata NRRL Y-17804]